MTNILAIKGTQDKGKTTTAWLIYFMLRDYASSIRFWCFNGEEIFPPQHIQVWNKDQRVWETLSNGTILPIEKIKFGDFFAVLTIKGRVWVINSAGDNNEIIMAGLSRAMLFCPDNIILCSRTKGQSDIDTLVKDNPAFSLLKYTPSNQYGQYNTWHDYLEGKYPTAHEIVLRLLPEFQPDSNYITNLINNILK